MINWYPHILNCIFFPVLKVRYYVMCRVMITFELAGERKWPYQRVKRGNSSDVTFDTEASKLVSKKQNISHRSTVSELD